MKLRYLFLLSTFVLLLAACGNDKDLEAKFINEINRGIKQLKSSKTTSDITLANDILDNAYKIEGAEELDETKAVRAALDEFDEELEKAQERVLDSLQLESIKEPDLDADSI